MWKSIVLCVSLFGGAAFGLALGARFVEPAAVPAAAAIVLCVIGVVLILAAPTGEDAIETQGTRASSSTGPTAVEPVELPTAPQPVVSNRTPTLPFEALNS
jgi:hypothetical protein